MYCANRELHVCRNLQTNPDQPIVQDQTVLILAADFGIGTVGAIDRPEQPRLAVAPRRCRDRGRDNLLDLARSGALRTRHLVGGGRRDRVAKANLRSDRQLRTAGRFR